MTGLSLLPAPTRSSAQIRNCSAKAGRFKDHVSYEPPRPCMNTTCGALAGPAIRQWIATPPTSTTFSSASSEETVLASSAARCTSSRPIIPPGPVPATIVRSTPSSCASRLAAGDAFTRPPALVGARTTPGEVPVGEVLGAARCWVSISALWRLISASSRSNCATCSSERCSPGRVMTAMAAPTGALSPSCISIDLIMPVTGASTSLVAFSLSICTIGSPCWTGSPAFLSHSTISPVFIDKPHLGILKIVATILLLLSATGTNKMNEHNQCDHLTPRRGGGGVGLGGDACVALGLALPHLTRVSCVAPGPTLDRPHLNVHCYSHPTMSYPINS